MTTPDIRQRIIEHVVELAARKGVEDLKLVVANALHRRMTADEIKRMVGERVFRSFWRRRRNWPKWLAEGYRQLDVHRFRTPGEAARWLAETSVDLRG